MAHFSCNPYIARIPDFASDTFARRRQSIASSGLTEQEIIEFMQGTRHDAIEAKKQHWARTIHGTKATEDEEAAKMREVLAVRIATRKRCFSLTTMRGVPTSFPKIPAEHVMGKLRRGEYVALWHFIRNGLDSVKKHRDQHGVDPYSGAQEVVADSKLSCSDFRDSTVRLLQMMGLTHWPQKTIDMFHIFDEVHCHTFASHGTDVGVEALMQHASEQRQLWHLQMKDVMTDYEKLHILKIDEDLLAPIVTDVDRRHRAEEICNKTVAIVEANMEEHIQFIGNNYHVGQEPRRRNNKKRKNRY